MFSASANVLYTICEHVARMADSDAFKYTKEELKEFKHIHDAGTVTAVEHIKALSSTCKRLRAIIYGAFRKSILEEAKSEVPIFHMKMCTKNAVAQLAHGLNHKFSPIMYDLYDAVKHNFLKGAGTFKISTWRTPTADKKIILEQFMVWDNRKVTRHREMLFRIELPWRLHLFAGDWESVKPIFDMCFNERDKAIRKLYNQMKTKKERVNKRRVCDKFELAALDVKRRKK